MADSTLHPVLRRLKESFRANFTCSDLSTLCKNITTTCTICSEMKYTNVLKDGKLPLRDDKIIMPWEILSVDLYGPWKIKYEVEK